MNSYYYEVLDSDSHPLKGYLSAETEEKARMTLKSQNYSVLTLKKSDKPQNESAKSGSAWEFFGKNKSGKNVKGTIKDNKRENAEKRLKEKYGVIIDYLIPAGLSDEAKNKVIEKYHELHKTDIVKVSKAAIAQKEKETKLDQIHAQIEGLLVEVPTFLAINKQFIQPLKLREVEDRLNQFSRLRHSNALDNLQRLLDEMMALMNGDNFFINDEHLSADAKADLDQRKDKLRKMASSIEQQIFSSMYNAYDNLKEKSTNEILHIIWHPFEIVGFVLYMFFFSMFFLLIAFWFFSIIMGPILGKEVYMFFLHSPLLWFLTAVSLIVSIMFVWVFIEPKPQMTTKLTFIGAGIVALGLLTLEFPIIFFWAV